MSEHGAPFGVFHVELGHGGAEGQHTASALPPCLGLSDSTPLADDFLGVATAWNEVTAMQHQADHTQSGEVQEQ